MSATRRLLMEKQHEVESIRDRIRDLEWEAEYGSEDDDECVEERRRAIDKLRFTRDEMHTLELKLLDEDKPPFTYGDDG